MGCMDGIGGMNGMDGIKRLNGMFRMVVKIMAVWTDGVDRMDNMYRMEWIGSYRIELQRQVLFSKRMTSLFLSILSNSICTYERCKYVQRVHTGIKFSPEQLNSVPARLLCTTVLLTVAEVLNQGTPVSTAHNQN